jgi:predicted metal-dependent phosphoesterase TrpH
VIDLHLHTTASDGRSSPSQLVRKAAGAGIRVMSVTDHDTMAGVASAAEEAAMCGIDFVPGIEITAVHAGKDVHVLGYFVDPSTPRLHALLAAQRQERLDRAREIASRLAAQGVPIDTEALLQNGASRGGKALARPQIAQALIDAGHVETVAEAFDRYLGEGCPAYVPHDGATPAQVVEVIGDAGGLASLAHPGQRRNDKIIPELVGAGLAAIEAYHSSHDEATQAHYVATARRFELAVTGGSDYHGEGTRRAEFFGVTALPREEFATFIARANRVRQIAAHRLAVAWGIA